MGGKEGGTAMVAGKEGDTAMDGDNGDMRPAGTDAAPHFVREGMRLARDLCRDLGLPDPHAPGLPAPALIAGLAATRGWTVTARVATPAEWRGLEELNAWRRGGEVSTGEVRPTGPAAWEIVVIPSTTAFHRTTIILTLLAYIVRDDVPATGRARLASGGATYEDAVARVFAREVERIYLRASGWPRRFLDTPRERPASASWLLRLAHGILRLSGIDDPDGAAEQAGAEAGDGARTRW